MAINVNLWSVCALFYDDLDVYLVLSSKKKKVVKLSINVDNLLDNHCLSQPIIPTGIRDIDSRSLERQSCCDPTAEASRDNHIPIAETSRDNCVPKRRNGGLSWDSARQCAHRLSIIWYWDGRKSDFPWTDGPLGVDLLRFTNYIQQSDTGWSKTKGGRSRRCSHRSLLPFGGGGLSRPERRSSRRSTQSRLKREARNFRQEFFDVLNASQDSHSRDRIFV